MIDIEGYYKRYSENKTGTRSASTNFFAHKPHYEFENFLMKNQFKKIQGLNYISKMIYSQDVCWYNPQRFTSGSLYTSFMNTLTIILYINVKSICERI